MKILFFIESLHSGGKERRLVELIKALLIDSSIEIILVLTKKNIHYKDILLTKTKIYYTIRRKGLKKDPKIFYQFFKIVKIFRPDVIHVWGNLVAFYAIPTKILLKIPLINNQITDVPIKTSKSFFGPRTTFRFSNKIIANSIAGLKAYNGPKKKSKVIYNGFNFDRLENLDNIDLIRNNHGIRTKFVVGMVASFSKLKDYETYIKAANIILNKNKDVTFLCIGSGDDDTYRELVTKENRDKILFLGMQHNVESIMNVCDIGVLSTFTEGISNALLEFSALGKPIIATDGGGTNELIENGKNGYLIEQRSIEGLIEKINIFIEDAEKRKTFGKTGRIIVKNKFSNQKMLDSYLKIYNELTLKK